MKAAALVIGNEILSGKVTDTNTPFLARHLRAQGVELVRVAVVPDEVPTIAAWARLLAAEADVVFTSGGIGPTHDDVTYAGIAAAEGVGLMRFELLERWSKRYLGEANELAWRKMSELPEGTELVFGDNPFLVTPRVGKFYILPGIPKYFEARLTALMPQFQAAKIHLINVYFTIDEGPLAQTLADLERRIPGLQVGSYPVVDQPAYRVKVTLESRSIEDTRAAKAVLLDAFPAETIHRVED